MRNFLFLPIVFIVVYGVCAFNLDPRIPVIKRGFNGSYFGYSVAEHQEKISDTNPRVKQSWMLVGAPLGKNLQPDTNRSGALFKCPLTTLTSDCEQVITDGRTAEDESQGNSNIDSDELVPPSNKEIKENQWLGVTVDSQPDNGKIMVCAHRYIGKTDNSQWGQGQCYILTHNFKHLYLRNPCTGKPTDRGHEAYGYCQAGTSGVLTSENRVVMGAPGPLNWKGEMFLYSVDTQIIYGDNTVYNTMSPVEKYSYLGMSVAVGRFFGEDKGLAYASGAPRSNGTGQVLVFIRHDRKPPLEVALILDGEQFASSYGYEIASADVNGDKTDDLIVAAPFYFNKSEGGAVYVYTKLCRSNVESEECRPTKLVGREESRFGFAISKLGDLNKDGYEDIAIGAPYEGKGTVYVYLGSRDGISTVPQQVIHAEEMPITLRTFGYSLSGGTDMDDNGYPDLLVGAYDDDAAVLLRARKIIDITTHIRYARKDEAYQEKIEPIDPNKIGCATDPSSNNTCFSFIACCKTASLGQEGKMQYLRLSYYVEAETYSGERKFSRVWFVNGTTRPQYINRIVTLNASNLEYCQTETVYLKENTRDIQSPIQFQLNYTLIQEEPTMPAEGDTLPDIMNYPILNQQNAVRKFEATFQKDCGNNDICESDLNIYAKLNLSVLSDKTNLYELLLGEREEVVVDVSAVNVGESAYEAQLFIRHSPSLNYIASKSNDSIICHLHNTSMIMCSIGNPFKNDKVVNIQVRFDPKGVEDNESQLEFVVFANSTSQEVSEKKPIRLRATVVKRAELSIKGSAKTQWAFYGGKVVGESAIKHLNEVGPRVSHSYEIFNEGPWKVSSVEVRISWPYEVANDKQHGKWLLYLEEMPTVRALGEGECMLPSGHRVNPLDLQGSYSIDDLDLLPSSTTVSPNFRNYTSSTRRRRDTEKVVNTRTIIDKDGHRSQVVSMIYSLPLNTLSSLSFLFQNCKAGTAKCFEITCVIYNLQRKQEAVISVKARLWNSTLVEDYPRVDTVKIGSNAKIVIPPGIGIQQENVKDDSATAETIAYPDLLDQQDGEPVPIWIIIVAIVAGLLLLILLTLVLWKLGFFKRRRPDPTLSGNLEKHRDDNPESEALFNKH